MKLLTTKFLQVFHESPPLTDKAPPPSIIPALCYYLDMIETHVCDERTGCQFMIH
jgi:hypothetical protein